MPDTAPYGSWKSPISADLTAGAALSFTGLALDGRDLFWLEGRPAEGGRYTIMHRASDGIVTECTPADFNVRSTVHEYGGAAFSVSQGFIYFQNYRDQRLYRQRLGGLPEALTPAEGYRYADIILDHRHERLICVREDHTAPGEAINTIVAISIRGNDNGAVLASGNDFYSNPRLSPDGSQLAYLTWNHPNMPWDGCELRLAPVGADGSLGEAHLIAGGDSASVFQPEWSPDGVLHFVAEHTGWWNLYRWDSGAAQPLCPMTAEFGRPMWMFGYATYGFASPNKILCCYTQQGVDHLAWLDSASGKLTAIASPYIEVDFLRCGDGVASFIGGSPVSPTSVVHMDFDGDRLLPIKRAFDVTIDVGYLSAPEAISFPTTGDRQAHALYYAPKNRDFTAPAAELPPLITLSHGGPTSATTAALRYSIQFWTSRGIAVVDVNYGGSVGYGRQYRRRLNGQWGVVDVDDCCNAALFLARRGLADRDRLIIKGGSAGGYTTFACLTFRNDVFRAGAGHFGVADLEIFTRDTHKFESQYLSTLVGPYPERKDLYLARSPINFVDNLQCPLILFHGDEDKIVPPGQSQMMFDAVRLKGLPTAYLLFPGEQHGFRQAATVRRAHEAELFFFSRIFEFEPAEAIEPVAIENLPAGV
ncbi:MAG: prolyl oligopeptidase family serine peptidase [Chloroflexota bacterium]